MSKSKWNEEIAKIIEEDKKYIQIIDGSNHRWGKVQNNKCDAKLKEVFVDFFKFSKMGTLMDVANSIKNEKKLSSTLKKYAFKRALNIRNSWLDEAYISKFEGVTFSESIYSYWDFEYKGIKWDLKTSQAPYNFDGFKSLESIAENTNDFIRAMFYNASTGSRANPYKHNESNRFFLIFKSDKDEKYYECGDTMNTTILRSNFNVKERVFDYIFNNFSDENIFHLKNVKYYWKNNKKEMEEHIYKDVFAFVCLINEDKNGKININMLKNN